MSCCAGLLRADRRFVLGAIIAGGKSTRFGSDKALATFAGRPLIEHVAEALGAQSAALVVVGRQHAGLTWLADQPAPDMGPLAGVAAALLEARARGLLAVLTAPCDAADLPETLLDSLHPAPAYVEAQPVIGLWPISAAETALAILNSDARHSMRAFAETIGARPVQLLRNPANINTAADLRDSNAMGYEPQADFGTPASTSETSVTLTIDGRKVTVPAGTSVMRAAAETGGNIPKLCATDSVKSFGSCRLCLVEIEGARGTPASCTTPVGEGMVVKTQTERLQRLRKGVMELYISDHPLDCLTCSDNNDCELQDNAAAVGLRDVRFGYSGENHLGLAIDTSTPISTSTRASASPARAACAHAMKCRERWR